MRKQIYRSLLLTGLISVIAAFLVAGILYYQGIQARAIHEIGHITEIAADGITGDRARDIAYLETIRDKSERKLRITWADADGTLRFESKLVADADLMEAPEIKQALAEGKGYAVRKDTEGQPMSFFARALPDGSVLRFSVAHAAPAGIISPLLPEIGLFFIVFFFGCIAAASRETEYVIAPVKRLEGLISDIMIGVPERKISRFYDELRPLVDKVREQKKDLQSYMDDLEEERNTIRTVVDTIADGLILLNEEQEIVDYNVRVREIFNTAIEPRFKKLAVLYHDEDWLRAVGMTYQQEERSDYTMTIGGRPYRASMAPIELADGEHGLLIVLHDLSATYAAEKMRREFSANVSHELKTPLTSISGFAEMIANGMYQNEDDVRHFGSRIFEESHRMLALIETIMHLSKIEENQTTITWRPVDMAQAARYAAELLEPQANAKHITIRVDAEPSYVYGNQALLFELVMNCMDNAVKYNKDGGEVSVTVRAEGDDNLRISVSDTGVGIPEEKQGRVFERFYRAEESRNKATGGSGLGLAICKHIVAQHRGTISIASVEGEGTTLEIILPRMSQEDVKTEEEVTSAAQIEAAKAESGELIAEAEAEAAETIKLKKNKKDKEKEKDKDKKGKAKKDSKDGKDKNKKK